MEAIVEYNYEAREADELTLRKGDIIKNIKVLQGGWWEGTLKDKRGMFPDNFVKVLDSSSSVAGGTEMASSTDKSEESVVLRNGGSARKWCKVLFSYEPMNSDELQLVTQDSIEFLGEVEEGWWRGRLRGQVGVFPSNFVAPPVPEEKQLYRVLFPYEAVNEDELTLAEGDVITLLSKDAPDKGWWKGELKGQIGLFPDNFVELICAKNSDQDQERKQDSSQVNTKASAKTSHSSKRNEKAHVRKSLDAKNIRSVPEERDILDLKKGMPVNYVTRTLPFFNLGGNNTEKKSPGNHSIISSLKRFVGDGSSNSGNSNNAMALGEELDEVERGEGTPLSHLTASRAKAPRRRPPTAQHLRILTNTTSNTNINATNAPALLEENLTNGSIDNLKSREDEGDGVVSKVRRKAPWVEELKLNQLERKKIGLDKSEKFETPKERGNISRLQGTATVESDVKAELDSDDVKVKEDDKLKRAVTHTHQTPSHEVLPSPPGYVPYHIFNQLLERVCLLEENQLALQRTVNQLTQMIPNSPNYPISNKE